MKKTGLSQLVWASLLMVGVATTWAAASPAPESFAPLAARLKPSVVNISTTKVVRGGQRFHGDSQPRFRGPNDPSQEFGDDFFRRFFGDQKPREFKAQSLGSGFILDDQGYILTNNHVVESQDEILVRLSDEHEFKAKLIGADDKTDIALIKIEPKDVTLVPVQLGDSDSIQVGDWVVAIGNPFGFGHTVTAGIISAKERVIGSGPYDNFLQTDAAINPGNSGGPLFDAAGRVIGINTAIVSGGTGLGFAIPVNMARQIVPQLRKEGKVTRGWLGVMIQEISPELARSFGLDEAKGALVSEVSKDGPADKAGLKRGDVIVEFDGVAVDRMNQLPRLVAGHAPGSGVKVVVLRDGKKNSVDVTLGELPGEESAKAELESQLGMTVQEITPELRTHLDVQDDSGVVVSGVEPGGAAAEAGLRRGDVIVEANQEPVKDLKAYRKAIREGRNKESVLFLVRRGTGTLFVVVRLGK
ncbi:MAG: DegQ family serine endoprotease [Deltaproteobacteria bacterium]|nr:DegQ family serine endoprotease [Deltaproteobacteria bacterium]